MIVKLRVAPAYTSADAKPFASILGPRALGCQFREIDLSPEQIATLRAAVGADGRRIFQIAGDPPAPPAEPASAAEPVRRLVVLGGRQVDLAGRHRVVVRGAARVRSPRERN